VDIVTYEDEDVKNFKRSGGMGGAPAPFLTDVAHEKILKWDS
jgi:hypothetical protein